MPVCLLLHGCSPVWLHAHFRYGLDLFLLSIDEGISGYRDDSLETVKRNEAQYQVSAGDNPGAWGCQPATPSCFGRMQLSSLVVAVWWSLSAGHCTAHRNKQGSSGSLRHSHAVTPEQLLLLSHKPHPAMRRWCAYCRSRCMCILTRTCMAGPWMRL